MLLHHYNAELQRLLAAPCHRLEDVIMDRPQLLVRSFFTQGSILTIKLRADGVEPGISDKAGERKALLGIIIGAGANSTSMLFPLEQHSQFKCVLGQG